MMKVIRRSMMTILTEGMKTDWLWSMKAKAISNVYSIY
jgi:hypothetical protein